MLQVYLSDMLPDFFQSIQCFVEVVSIDDNIIQIKRQIFQFRQVKMSSMSRSNMAGMSYSPNGITVKRKRSWQVTNAVLSMSSGSILTCQ